MLRRLLNLLTALSLLLCVAVGALWLRSHSRCDTCRWDRNHFDDPLTRGPILVEYVVAKFECGRAAFLWWRYESYEWTGSVHEPGFHAESRPSSSDGSDFRLYAKSDLGCWLHRSVSGVELHAASVNEPPPFYNRFHVYRIGVPLWLLATMTAVVPGWRALACARRHRFQGTGLCPACGYDLTGNASGVCPECGGIGHG
jgi:hypothetical protein